MSGAFTRGVVFVHSAPRALCPHIEWAVGTVLDQRVSLDWTLQPAVAGMVRGARVVATYPRGNTYATELELDTRNLYHLNQLMAGQF